MEQSALVDCTLEGDMLDAATGAAHEDGGPSAALAQAKRALNAIASLNMSVMFASLRVTHELMLAAKLVAPLNMLDMSRTFDTNHPLMSWLNARAPLNMSSMRTAADVSQALMSWLNDARL